MLERPFGEEEVKSVIMGMKGDKVPRPNGLQSLSFKSVGISLKWIC